jgi:hypothetical protein
MKEVILNLELLEDNCIREFSDDKYVAMILTQYLPDLKMNYLKNSA